MKDSPAELFELFWENSKFSDVTIGEFQKRIEEYAGFDHERPGFQFPGTDHALPLPKDALAKTMRQRRSGRQFSTKPITAPQLGSLLVAFGQNAYAGRTFASAGGTYALEVFCLLNHYDGELDRTICYYNADNHSLSVVGSLPAWEDYQQLVNIDLAGTTPPVLFVLALVPRRTTVKYGERGGRFALIEAGQAAQNLALRLVQEDMIGVEIGGLLDNQVQELIGLGGTSAQVALGFACGHSS